MKKIKRDLRILRDLLEKYTDLVFFYQDAFIDRFCKGEVMDLLDVSFSDESVHIRYVLDCGQHICDTFTTDEFCDWVYEVLDEN
jgi:hypothetical protein